MSEGMKKSRAVSQEAFSPSQMTLPLCSVTRFILKPLESIPSALFLSFLSSR